MNVVARIRSLKPEFATSPDTGALPVHLAAHLPRLWTYVDDEGRGVDDPKLIKAAVWPLQDAVTPEMIEGWQAELGQLGRIVRYLGPDGRKYFAVPKFTLHQKPRRFVPSRLPSPPSNPDDDVKVEQVKTGGTLSEQVQTSSDIVPAVDKDVDKAGEGHCPPVVGVGVGGCFKTPSGIGQAEANLRGVPESSSSESEPAEILNLLWRNWPSGRKGTQAEVRRRWAEIVSNNSDLGIVAIGFEAWLAFWRADETPTRFIPKLSNWLRDQGWTETPPATRAAAGAETATGHPSTETALGLYLSGRAAEHPFVEAVARTCTWDPLRVPQQATWDFKARYEAALFDAAQQMSEMGG